MVNLPCELLGASRAGIPIRRPLKLGDTFMSGFLVSGLVGPFEIAVVPKTGEIGANWYMYRKGEKLAHIKSCGKNSGETAAPKLYRCDYDAYMM